MTTTTKPTMPRYNIYKVDRPHEMLDMPGTHKWAVGVQYVESQGFGFHDAFKTRRAARDYINKLGHCFLCGEKYSPQCGCEREFEEQSKRMNEPLTRDEYITYLRRTLIPELIECGRASTAHDFRSIVRCMTKPGQKDEESFCAYLKGTLIPDMREAGFTGTADDLQLGLDFITKG